ncbi:MAG: hypothetical protein IJV88_02365 [Ruminococcus sp.]|nr:hypothetical protein [Ruminococcus sp.]
MENKDTFSFIYSAKEQEEIKAIRNKYTTPQESEDNMTRLRRLDSTVTNKATAVSLVLGIIGTLIMGSGMSLVMTDLADLIGINNPMLTGIVIGLAGIVLLCLAYPVYNRIIRHERKKIAPEILRLTDELMK